MKVLRHDGVSAVLPATLYDGRRYCLTIDIDGVQHHVTEADPVSQPAVAELIAFITTVSRR